MSLAQNTKEELEEIRFNAQKHFGNIFDK